MSAPDSIAVALSTLQHGATFLGQGLRTVADGNAIEGQYQAKVIANGLRELDRFLNILADAVAAALKLPPLEQAKLSRQRNTANKLRQVHEYLGLSSPHHERLLAIGRYRNCLFYRGGAIDPGVTPQRFPISEPAPSHESGANGYALIADDRLVIDMHDITDMCRFYVSLGDALVSALVAHERLRSTAATPPASAKLRAADQ